MHLWSHVSVRDGNENPKTYLVSQHLPSERTLGGIFFMSFFTQRGGGGGERVRPSALPPPPCMVPVFDLNIYFREQTLVLMMKMIALLPSTVIKKHFTFRVCLLIVVRLCMIWTVEWCEIIVKLGKPWTPEIFLECYCGARKKPIGAEKTKPQARTLITLWFCHLLTCPDLCCDWL